MDFSDKDLLVIATKAWKRGLPVPAEIENELVSRVPDFFKNKIFFSLIKLKVGKNDNADFCAAAEKQRHGIIHSAAGAVSAIPGMAMPARIDYSNPSWKGDLREDLRNLRQWKEVFDEHMEIFNYFPELFETKKIVDAAVEQPSDPWGRANETIIPLMKEKAISALYAAVRPSPDMVSGWNASQTVGEVLEAMGEDPRLIEWTAEYFKACLSLVPPKKMPGAAGNVLSGSARYENARHVFNHEAAVFAAGLPEPQQRAISEHLSKISRNAKEGAPQKSISKSFSAELDYVLSIRSKNRAAPAKESGIRDAAHETEKGNFLEKAKIAWPNGETLQDYEELLMLDQVTRPGTTGILLSLAKIAPKGENAKAQKEKALAAAQPAIEKISSQAMRDARALAYARTENERKAAKAKAKEARAWLYSHAGLANYFPGLKAASEAILISLDQPYFSNAKTELLIAPLLRQGADQGVLDAVSPSPGIVYGIGARGRINAILSAKPEGKPANTDWAVNYLCLCIVRSPPGKKAKAVMNLTREASEILEARKAGISEAAAIASKLTQEDHEYISAALHRISRKADPGSPAKTLFADFAQEIRKHEASPLLFPVSVDEMQKAGGKFWKGTTVILGSAPATADAQERAATPGQHPLEALLEGFDGKEHAVEAAPVEKAAKMKFDKTLLLSPQPLARMFAEGKKVDMEELDPSVFEGQPPHRLINAAHTLMAVKVQDKEQELVRNGIVTSLLSELEIELATPTLEKRYGRATIGAVPPETIYRNMLMEMHKNSDGLRELISDLNLLHPAQSGEESAAAKAQPAPATAAPPAQPAAPASPEAAGGEEVLELGDDDVQSESRLESEYGELSIEYPPGVSEGELLDSMGGDAKKHEAAKPRQAEPPDRRIRSAFLTVAGGTNAKRSKAYEKIRAHFSEGRENYAARDLIKGLSAYLSHSEDADSLSVAYEAAEALISLPEAAKWGPVEAMEIRRTLASADPEIVDVAVLSRIRKGTEAEKAEALLVLVERAEISGRPIPEGASIYKAALGELMELGPQRAIPALFSLAGGNCPEMLLQDALCSYPEREAGKVAVEIISKWRAEMPETEDTQRAIFAEEASSRRKEQVSKHQARLATTILQIYGGGLPGEEFEESVIAKGVVKVANPQAIEFLIQGMDDAGDTAERQVWQHCLREISTAMPYLVQEAESRLIGKFHALNNKAQDCAFELLIEKPSLAQAEFLLKNAYGGESRISGKAAAALLNYDFSNLTSRDSFAIIRRMHRHPRHEISEKAGVFLDEFLPGSASTASEWMDARFLEGLLSPDKPAHLKNVREALVLSAGEVLSSRYRVSGLGNMFDSMRSENKEIAILAKYALAAEMRSQGDRFSTDFHKALFLASSNFKKDGDEEAVRSIITAAYSASTREAMRQVLVPYLCTAGSTASLASSYLLSTNEGAGELALAAAGMNHPKGLSAALSAKLSERAMAALSAADTEFASRALVSLLENKKDDLHLSAYEALAKAGDSKCTPLLEALSSGDGWVRYAAVRLLPVKERFIQKVLPLVCDVQSGVSAGATEYVLSAAGKEGLASVLTNPEISAEAQQAIGSYCIRKKPGMVEALITQADKEGAAAENALRALSLLPSERSAKKLLSVLNSGKETAPTARESLLQICDFLQAVEDGNAEDAARLILQIYADTTDKEVRSAVVDAAKGPFAQHMLDEAAGSGESPVAFPALQVFLATGNIEYASTVALAIRSTGLLLSECPGIYEPAFQVLFSVNPSKIAEIAPHTPEYDLLQEVAEQEFVHGCGARESRELLSVFIRQFGSREVRDSLFEKGPLAVSEFVWSMRGEPSEEKALLWLRSMKDERINMMLDALCDNNYSVLGKLMEDGELFEIVLSHAMRRAACSFAELSKGEGASAEKARGGLELYAQLLSRDPSIGMPSQRKEWNWLYKNIGFASMITEPGIAQGDRLIRSLCQEITDVGSMSISARSEGRKLARRGAPEGAAQPAAPQKLERGK